MQRQARCILIDPYANAFTPDPTAKSNLPAINDMTDMKPGVAERKWEIDSLCYPMRLAHAYWTATRDKAPFDDLWAKGMALAVATLREQQRKDGPGGLSLPARRRFADRDADVRRLRRADEEGGPDPFGLPPLGRCLRLSRS